MKKLYLIGLALIAAMVMVLPSTAQAVPLTNPGFDADTSFPPTGWTQAGSGYAGAVEAESWAKSSPNILKFWSSSGETYTFQDFSVVAGTPYTVNIWAYTDSGDAGGALGWDGFVKIEYPGYSTTAESTHFDGSITDTWVQLTAQATAPVGATTGRINIVFADNGGSHQGSIAFDEASANAVPEPTSLLLLGGGLVGLFSITRKKR